jgi:hypothetical protein
MSRIQSLAEELVNFSISLPEITPHLLLDLPRPDVFA